ncbi:MAG: SDR family oxidoreductase [Thermus sp.]|uniref:SDR family NAD(P)-dependent oxidoreductase n=1 Tax=Thermus sp. TaxID=275 RepID=UPI002601222B|nr:SDR family NAD(P)-dependent oxidoreductase [Thermus sp.]MCS7219270.1 SDR family oxidoreductase [Thermus sp.]
MWGLRGRHALVTGASRGIGAAVAEALAQRGARLTLIAREEGELLRRVDLIRRATGAEVQGIPADLTDPSSAEGALNEAFRRLGPVTILVNNVGFVSTAPFLETGPELWWRHLEGNLMTAYRCIRRLLPGMLAEGWGRIVNVASTAGLTGYPYASAYCAAKHALIGLTRSLALELARKGVTVNAVCPGFTDTDLLRRAAGEVARRTGRGEEEVLGIYASRNPQGRLVRPEEVAWAVVWLCSEEAAPVNGQSIVVAGGEVLAG